jgi:hypothetical protein
MVAVAAMAAIAAIAAMPAARRLASPCVAARSSRGTNVGLSPLLYLVGTDAVTARR